MKWWQKALIATVVLIVLDAGFAFVMYQHIQNTSANVQIESIRHEKLGEVCGQILGVWLVIIWIWGYLNQKLKKRTS